MFSVVYAVELSTNNVYVDEGGETIAVCAVVTGRYDHMDENITVTLRFTDSPLAGTVNERTAIDYQVNVA